MCPKINMDTESDGLENVSPASTMANLGIHVKFRGIYEHIHCFMLLAGKVHLGTPNFHW